MTRHPCEIGVYPDGPLLVRGPFTMRGPDGRDVTVRRRTVALCRCGGSRAGAFCDGTHRTLGFTTRAPAGAGEGGGTASPSAG